MSDLLVRLWDIPDKEELLKKLKQQSIIIRKPIGAENYAVIRWIDENFGSTWASESESAFFKDKKTIYIAVRESENEGKITSEMLGFACYDATLKGFFGPTGVSLKERGQGIGQALLFACLHDMKEDGYGYCVIGDAGPSDFYKKACGATVIENSTPGIYRGMLS